MQPTKIPEYKIAFDMVIENEGIYDNDKDDSGGETVYGISRKNFPDWDGWHIVDGLKKGLSDKKSITDKIHNSDIIKNVESFYFEHFWIKAMCAEINPKIAIFHFDTAINMGIKTANKLLQRSLGFNGSDIDGIIGKKTLSTLKLSEANNVLTRYKLNRKMRYVDIVEKNPTQQKFLKGWNNRLDSVMAVVNKFEELS
jgi:lysozyme family protein